jgi:nicotinamide riboside kinase
MEENLKQQPTEVIKIALYGPERTGKTTLSEQLAQSFQTTVVPEFARTYLQKKWNSSNESASLSDMMPIVLGQVEAENNTLSKANTVVFCDSCAMVTKVFSELNFSQCDPTLEKAAKKHKYDLFFLMDIDVAWEQDDMAGDEIKRKADFEKFEKALIDYKKPYIKLSGSSDKRFAKANAIVADLIKAKKLGLNSIDFLEIYNRKINLDIVAEQFEILRNGIPKINLDRPAVLNDGIVSLSPDEATYYANFFEEKKKEIKLEKFVPASGAASRMFKFLSEFIMDFKLGVESINAYINRTNNKDLAVFLFAKEKLPFYKTIIEAVQSSVHNYESLEKDTKDYFFIKYMLSSEHFDYANKPKGVLPFHQYGNYSATAIEEHLNECLAYAASKDNSHLHFTVSDEHQSSFERIVNQVKPKLEVDAAISIEVKYSYQNKSTDVIAMNWDGLPFRDENDQIVFRPGGHGALIENLNQLTSDIVFIKNIDNVIQNQIQVVALYKKALAGMLMSYQNTIFNFLRLLDEDSVSREAIDEIVLFLNEKLAITLIDDFSKYTKESKIEYLQNILNRPIRVCGMVKNEGEPGGGPFWVTDKKGNTFLQIIEASQVDVKDAKQMQIMANSTHFNPVDLVCGLKDYRHQKFDLSQYVDKNTGFVVEKNKNGKPYKAFELPGLWNGAMAKWLTVFVEVPLITFNPVKTVNDLLKPAHQAQ